MKGIHAITNKVPKLHVLLSYFSLQIFITEYFGSHVEEIHEPVNFQGIQIEQKADD